MKYIHFFLAALAAGLAGCTVTPMSGYPAAVQMPSVNPYQGEIDWAKSTPGARSVFERRQTTTDHYGSQSRWEAGSLYESYPGAASRVGRLPPPKRGYGHGYRRPPPGWRHCYDHWRGRPAICQSGVFRFGGSWSR